VQRKAKIEKKYPTNFYKKEDLTKNSHLTQST